MFTSSSACACSSSDKSTLGNSVLSEPVILSFNFDSFSSKSFATILSFLSFFNVFQFLSLSKSPKYAITQESANKSEYTCKNVSSLRFCFNSSSVLHSVHCMNKALAKFSRTLFLLSSGYSLIACSVNPFIPDSKSPTNRNVSSEYFTFTPI